jgi:hypothetical protein
MRKSLIILGSALFLATASIAQDETSTSGSESSAPVLKSKKGEMILPEEGDWSIGIDATPILNFGGNLLNGNAFNNAPTWQHYGANQTIVGKLFKDEETAYRFALRLGRRAQNDVAEINLAQAMPVPDQFFGDKIERAEDSRRIRNSFVGLGVGLEKRRGSTRLQGFYGGELMMWFAGARANYNYANALTQNTSGDEPNVNPNDANYSTNWGTNNLVANVPNHAGVTGARILSQRAGTTIGFGVRGFIGAEYFFLPKISVAGEFGWGIGYQKNGSVTTTYEAEGFMSDGSEAAAQLTNTVKGGNQFIIDTYRNAINGGAYNLTPSGTLRLNFHF